MPGHYGLDYDYQTYEQQRRLLQQLQQQIPAQVQQARELVNQIYGSKQNGPCELLNDEELARRCRGGILPQSYPNSPYSPGDTGPGNDGNGLNGGNGGNESGGNGGGE